MANEFKLWCENRGTLPEINCLVKPKRVFFQDFFWVTDSKCASGDVKRSTEEKF